MMTDHTYKHIELTGSSTKSSDDAVRNAIAQAAKTVRNLRGTTTVHPSDVAEVAQMLPYS